MSTFTERAGLAFGLGAPLGAAVDAARNTTSVAQVSVLGRSFAQQQADAAGAALAQSAGRLQVLSEAPVDPVSAWIDSHITGPALTALNYPVEKVGQLASAHARTIYKDVSSGNIGGALLHAIPAPSILTNMASQVGRDSWTDATEAKASPGQTLWLTVQGTAKDASYDDAYGLVDDPSRYEERTEYFNSGAAKWTTGTFDFAFSTFADPLVVGGKAAGLARAARNTIKASDVAAVASGARNLTNGAKRVDAFVNRVVDASERVKVQRDNGVAGGLTDLTSTKAFGQTADAGAIPYFMQRLDDTVADAAQRIEQKRNAILAGMGNKDALAKLEAHDRDLALELESYVGPNRDTAVASLLLRTDKQHIENLRAVNEDDWVDRLVQARRDDIVKTQEALARTYQVGAPAGVPGLRGEITALTPARDVARVGKTIHKYAGHAPIHVVHGRHLPQTLSLASDDALQSFGAYMARIGKVVGKGAADQNKIRSQLDDFAATYGAANPGVARLQRAAIVERTNRAMTNTLVKKYAGRLDPHEVRFLIAEVQGRRTAEMAHLTERAQRAVAKGDKFAHTVTDDGVVVWEHQATKTDLAKISDPSQAKDMVALTDWAAVDRKLATAAKSGTLAGYVSKGANGALEMTEAGLAAFSDLWKFTALLRLGYPIRVQVDTQARLIATMGAMRYAGYLAEGSRNLLHNLKKVSLDELETATVHANARARLDDIEDMLPSEVTDAIRAEKTKLEELLASPLKVKGGTEKVRVRDTPLAKHVGMGGDLPAYRNALDFARARESYDASDSILGLMMNRGDAVRRNGLARSEHWQHVDGKNPLWGESYVRAVNQHVRNSTAQMKMLAGADDAAVVAWYKNDPVGRATWDGLSHHYRNVEELVAVQREQLDTLLPEGSAVRGLASAGELTEAQAKKAWTVEDRPIVPANMREAQEQGRRIARAYDNMRSRWFKFASEVPEEMLGRHPFYVDRMRGHLARSFEGLDRDALSLTQVNELYKRAGVLARRDVGAYLFDTAQRSNLAYHLRFLSPFYSAWSDTMRKWARIVGEHPEILPLIPKAFMAPNKAFVVQDKDGNRILGNGDVVDSEGNVVRRSLDWTEGDIVIPVSSDWLREKTGQDSFKVSKGSLNVIFQGEPWWLPGPGPLASIPVNEVALNAFPEAVDDKGPTGAVLRFFLPFGLESGGSTVRTGVGAVDRAADQALPMWAKNLMSGIAASHDDDRFAQTYAELLAAEMNAQRLGQTPVKSKAETQKLVSNRARNWFFLRFLGSEAPFSTRPESRIAFWRDEYQRYRRVYGGDAQQQFFTDHPDYFEAAISLSFNETGIAATDEAWDVEKKFAADIKANPKFGWMYVGAKNLTPGFDAGVYTAQKAQGLRTTKDPQQAVTDLQVSKGWFDYQRLAAVVNAKLYERKGQGGSASLSASSNADLADLRAGAVAALKADNPAWADAFEKGGTSGSVGEFFRAADEAVKSRPELADRPDFQTLQQYRTAREVLKEVLAQRGLKSIRAEGASDLAEAWDALVQDLVESDLGFEQMYTRGRLDADDLTGG